MRYTVYVLHLWGNGMLRADNNPYTASLKDSKTHFRGNVLYSWWHYSPVERSLQTLLDRRVISEDMICTAVCKNSLVGWSSCLVNRRSQVQVPDAPFSQALASAHHSHGIRMFSQQGRQSRSGKHATRVMELIWDSPQFGELDCIVRGSRENVFTLIPK